MEPGSELDRRIAAARAELGGLRAGDTERSRVLQSLLLGFRVLRGDVKVRLRPVAGIYQPILRTIWWGEK